MFLNNLYTTNATNHNKVKANTRKANKQKSNHENQIKRQKKSKKQQANPSLNNNLKDPLLNENFKRKHTLEDNFNKRINTPVNEMPFPLPFPKINVSPELLKEMPIYTVHPHFCYASPLYDIWCGWFHSLLNNEKDLILNSPRIVFSLYMEYFPKDRILVLILSDDKRTIETWFINLSCIDYFICLVPPDVSISPHHIRDHDLPHEKLFNVVEVKKFLNNFFTKNQTLLVLFDFPIFLVKLFELDKIPVLLRDIAMYN